MDYKEQLDEAISHMVNASDILFNISRDMFDKQNLKGYYKWLRQDVLEAIHSVDDSTELLRELFLAVPKEK